MKKVSIYSDGACSGNPGPGGWGAILVCEDPAAEKELSGGKNNTTNNRMEMTGVLEALRLLRQPCEVTVVTDSRYVVDAFNKNWIKGWQKNGWKTAAKKPVKNKELWLELLAAIEPHQIKWEWVRGHNSHPMNERADSLAVAAREKLA